MILTGREIKASIEQGLIDLEPLPTAKAFSSTSVDLRLDATLAVFSDADPSLERVVRPGHDKFDARRLLAELTERIDITGGHKLEPGRLVLGWTCERVDLRLRSRLAGRVEGKSSLARLGLAVHVTAPTIHAGFEGKIQLEIINYGPLPILLEPNMRICQLIFEQTLGVAERGYQGQFLEQGDVSSGGQTR